MTSATAVTDALTTKYGLAAVIIVVGTVGTLLLKLTFMTSALGIDGTEHPWAHPLFAIAITVFGRLIGGLLHWSCGVGKTVADSGVYGESDSALSAQSVSQSAAERSRTTCTSSIPFIVFVISVLDFIAVVLSNIGLLWTFASAYSLLRNASLVFTALISFYWHGNVLRLWQWMGWGLLLVGLVDIGVVSIVVQPSNALRAPYPWQGDALILTAQAFRALQLNLSQNALSQHGENQQAVRAILYREEKLLVHAFF